MKKALKIIGITLASIVGLVLVVGGIALAVFTSSGRLTKMVKKHAPEFVNCEVQLEKADLTLLKTFPNIGVEIDHVALINPMPGSPSDTLANIDKLTVVADAKKFLKEKEIVIRKCILEDAFVNLYTDPEGHSNLNVFNTKEKQDTTSTSFDYGVDIEEVKLRNSTVLYADSVLKMNAFAHGLDLDVKGKMQDKDINADLSLNADDLSLKMKAVDLALKSVDLDFEGDMLQMDSLKGHLKLSTPDICLDLGEEYLKNDTLNLSLPVQLSLKDKALQLDQAQIGLNDFVFDIDGDAAIAENGDVNMDLALKTNTLIIEDVLTYLPQNVQKAMSTIEYSGKLSISEAEVKGILNDSLIPLITAKVNTDKAVVNVPQLPYPFSDIDLDGLLTLDLTHKAGDVVVNGLNAKFNKSNLKVDGAVNDLLGDLGFDLKVKGDVPMNDIKGFLPKKMNIGGRANLDLKTDFTLKQLLQSLKDYNLNRLVANGTVKVNNFAFDMDTIHASAPRLDIGLALPASRKISGKKGAGISIAGNSLVAKVGKGIDAKMNGVNIKAAIDKFNGPVEKMDLFADMNFSDLDVVYDTITFKANAPVISLQTNPQKASSAGINAMVNFDGKAIDLNLGKAYTLDASTLKLQASAQQHKNKTDFLNKWNPYADFSLKDAEVHVTGIPEKIIIPNIDFLFNSHELGFKKSTVKIGQSDLSLEGNVIGIKEWIENHDNLMKGEMQVTSDFINFNEIMELTSGLGSNPDELAKEEKEEKDDDPFMVPKGVDFTFGIKTKKAIYDNFDLNRLGGQMTVKDGTLVLQEIGFTNRAAEMQLTAMYQSPRKNHLFLGMDFHLLNVQINDLLNMIPFIDTLVPMLKTFDGQAEFHIAAQTNLKSNYEPKISTLRAAADIEGQNLYVKDHSSLTKITNMLNVSTNGEYKVDSLDVQLTVFRDQVDLYPFLLSIGKYKAVASGRQNLDRTCNYHISVTDSPLPTRLGLDVTGTLGDLKYSLAPCKYKNLYRPERHNDTDRMTLELKNKIAESLKQNVL